MEQDKKPEKKKYSHNIFQNAGYVFKNLWVWNKGYLLAYFFEIPLVVFMPLMLIYFPKLLIDLLQRQVSDSEMIFAVIAYSAAFLAAKMIGTLCQFRRNSMRYVFSFLANVHREEKRFSTDFCNVDSPEGNDAFANARGAHSYFEDIADGTYSLLTNLLGIFTYGVLITMLSPVMLAVILATSAVNYIVLRMVRKFREKHRTLWNKIDRRVGYLTNISLHFEYAKDIRIFGMKGWLTGLLLKYQGERMSWRDKETFRDLMSQIIGAVLGLARNGAAYALLTYMLIDNRIGVDDFVLLFGAVTGLSDWISGILSDTSGLFLKCREISYIRDYLSLPDKYNHGNGAALPSGGGLPCDIEFKSVCYRYPGKDEDTIKDFSFKIKKGEKIALVGENGAGKSTLVKLLCGLYYPTSGQVLINGVSVEDYNITEYYTLFSAVFQDIALLPVTIARFISTSDGNGIDRERVVKSLKQADLYEKVSSLPNGIDTYLVKGIYGDAVDLSGGEKQKLMLARALYKNAPVIVLDEPTAALDPIAENNLYLKYNEMTSGKTSLYISHRLASTRFCDRIIFLDKGTLAESGSHDELMAKDGGYAYMFNVQSHYYKENIVEMEGAAANG